MKPAGWLPSDVFRYGFIKLVFSPWHLLRNGWQCRCRNIPTSEAAIGRSTKTARGHTTLFLCTRRTAHAAQRASICTVPSIPRFTASSCKCEYQNHMSFATTVSAPIAFLHSRVPGRYPGLSLSGSKLPSSGYLMCFLPLCG